MVNKLRMGIVIIGNLIGEFFVIEDFCYFNFYIYLLFLELIFLLVNIYYEFIWFSWCFLLELIFLGI